MVSTLLRVPSTSFVERTLNEYDTISCLPGGTVVPDDSHATGCSGVYQPRGVLRDGGEHDRGWSGDESLRHRRRSAWLSNGGTQSISKRQWGSPKLLYVILILVGKNSDTIGT
jgi:hypothetical protein